MELPTVIPLMPLSLLKDRFDDWHTVQATIIVAIVCILSAYFLYHKKYGPNRLYPKIPLIGKKRWEWTSKRAKTRWVTSARQIISTGLAQVNAPFQVITTVRPMIILPVRYIDEIKNHVHLNFAKAVENAFYGRYPGFEGLNSLNQNEIFQHAIRVGLTQSLRNASILFLFEITLWMYQWLIGCDVISRPSHRSAR